MPLGSTPAWEGLAFPESRRFNCGPTSGGQGPTEQHRGRRRPRRAERERQAPLARPQRPGAGRLAAVWRQSSQPASQPDSQPASQPARQPASQTASQPDSQTASQPASQPASQTDRQTASQPASQSARQPASARARLEVAAFRAEVRCSFFTTTVRDQIPRSHQHSELLAHSS